MWQNELKKQKHKLRKDEIVLKDCPFCGNTHFNFEVNSQKLCYHCWVCSASGKVQKLLALLGIPFESSGFVSTTVPKKKVVEFDLKATRKATYKDAPQLFSSKGLLEEDIEKYGFLIGTSGTWKNKLVMPLYENGELVYAVGRDLPINGRYYNPSMARDTLLPYYLGYLDRYRLYICEGIFDAISINLIQRTSVPLLGTNISDKQIRKIVNCGFEEVVVCLDGDVKGKALKMVKDLEVAGIDAYWVEFEGKEDPNELYVRDWKEFCRKMSKPKKASFFDSIKCMVGA